MALVTNEPLIKALTARLESDLPAIVDTLNAEATDPSYPLSHPVAVLDYVPPLSALVQFPLIGISEGPFELVDDTGWGATGVSLLTIILFEQDSDQRALVWRLRRWTQALARCVLDGRRLDPAGWGMTLRQIDPGPTLGREDDPQTMMSMVALTVQIKSEQDA